ncbi:oxidoreductase [Rhizobium sp. R634]|uniref:Gfo/Idh/MocA family protein n=1 Tax=Rhizobium sp. R634 TaxID=1764274 RepID=UPI000B52CA4E|nr:Gfo/Idh/MocA family oxidoreductase [Rhizobium sp. R634]OWV82406.1 oxidoreductase [Rhizobium sp. R634]
MKIGLVGTAHWASEIHAKGLARDPGLTFVGIWGRDRVKTAELAAEHEVAPYCDFGQFLSKVDAVAFAVAPGAQAKLAKTAAEHGKQVLIEKPIALTVDDGLALSEAIHKSGVRSVVFLTRLFHPGLRSQLAQAAKAPGLTHGRVRIVANSMRVPSPYINSTWRQSPRAALHDLGPHALSVLEYVLGSIVNISAELNAKGHILLSARHESGATSDAELALRALDEDLASETSFTWSGGKVELPQIDMVNGGAAEAYHEAIRQLTGGNGTYCDASYGLRLLRLVAECDEQLLISK